MASTETQKLNPGTATTSSPIPMKVDSTSAPAPESSNNGQATPATPRLPPLTSKTLPEYIERLDAIHEECKHDFCRYWNPDENDHLADPTTYLAMEYWLEKSLERFKELNTNVLLITNGDALYQAQKWADESNWGMAPFDRYGTLRQVISPMWVVVGAAIDELQDKVEQLERWLRGTATGIWWHQ
jgi:hypothetical protein